jgi:hypothetical protein
MFMASRAQTVNKTQAETTNFPAPVRGQEPHRSAKSQWPALALRSIGVRAKLAISQPGDAFEQEADRAADHVMRMTDTSDSNSVPLNENASGLLQRKCPECEEEEEKLKRKADGKDADVSPGHMKKELFSGSGQPLDSATREFFEPRFGRSFDDVRVYNNSRTDASARSINALAFTLGHNVGFRAGEYAPQTTGGRQLLAHELAHVAQRSGNDRVQRYRDVKTADKPLKNWGTIDDPKAGLAEKSSPAAGDPVIETIGVKFTGNASDKLNAGELLVTGTLTAKYRAKDKRSDIDIPVTGGTSADRPFGLTDSLKGTSVHKIQGPGYNDQPLKKGAGGQPAAAGETSSHYVKQTGTAGHAAFDFPSSMGLAVYFQGSQAIHLGDKSFGSHACIHVDWSANKDQMRLINYHSLIGFTKVTVEYDKNAAFKAVCCSPTRLKRGFANPCNVFSKADCSSTAPTKP